MSPFAWPVMKMCGPVAAVPSAPPRPVPAKFSVAPAVTVPIELKVSALLCAAVPLCVTVTPAELRRLSWPTVSFVPLAPELSVRLPPWMLITALLPMRSEFAEEELSSTSDAPLWMVTLVAPVAVPVAPENVTPPALTVSAPVKEFAPIIVSVPVPALVKPPVPETMPEKVDEVPSPPALSVPAPSVTLPAPASEPMPALKPATLKIAPPATVTRDEAGAEAALPSASVPVFTFVAPVNEFVPPSVSVPVPFFVMPPLPPAVPVNEVEVLSPPAMSVPAPRRRLPAPASEPTVSVRSFMSSVAPAETVTALAFGSVSVAPSRSVPALIVVAPVNVFAPEMSTVPVVFFVSPTLPASAAVTVPLCKVKPDVLVSTEPAPPRSEPLVSVTAPTLSVRPVPMSSVPPLTVSAPVPSASFAP